MPTTTGVTGSVAYEISGDPRFVFIHANGFCKELWHPTIEELGPRGYVSIDQPGHGESETPAPPFDWWDFGRNALAVIDAVGVESPVGVGHSSGGAALAMAEILRPGTFERLILVEPIIPPPPFERSEDIPLVQAALRRRRVFDSRDAVLDSYRGRGPFAGWDERALEAYATFGFEDTAGGYVLRCDPEVEAEVYRTHTAHGAWERVGEITCPVLLVAGDGSDTHYEAAAQALAARFSGARLHMIGGAGHFIPMTHSVVLAASISE